MSILLRVELIILSIVFLAIVFKTVSKRKLQVQYALLWIILSVGMLLLAAIPGVAEWLTELAGIETTSNFIYLLAILSLLLLTFSLTIIVSRQSQKIKKIIQSVSITETLKEENNEQ